MTLFKSAFMYLRYSVFLSRYSIANLCWPFVVMSQILYRTLDLSKSAIQDY